MSAVYSTQFVAGSASGVETSYTVPAGYVAVVRDVTTANAPSSASDYITAFVDGVVLLAFDYASATLFSVQSHNMRVVVKAGQKISFQSNYASGSCVVSGYLLSLP